MRDRKGVDPERSGSGGELGGAQRGETIIRIHCMKKRLFNKRKK